MKRTAAHFIRQIARRFRDDSVPDLSAQLAYYFLMALFPFLIFATSLLGYLVSVEDVLSLMNAYVPKESMSLIERNVRNVLEGKKVGILSFSLLAALWSSSNATNALIRALNRAYDVREDRPFWKERGIAIALTVALIVVILVALVLPVFGKAVGSFLFSLFGNPQSFLTVWPVIRWGSSFAILAAVLYGLYYFAPNRRLNPGDILSGTLFATISWQLASLGFSYAVDKLLNVSATYGSLASIVVLMIWFYLTGMIMILGGEINATIHSIRERP